jgi:hypothetical protein
MKLLKILIEAGYSLHPDDEMNIYDILKDVKESLIRLNRHRILFAQNIPDDSFISYFIVDRILYKNRMRVEDKQIYEKLSFLLFDTFKSVFDKNIVKQNSTLSKKLQQVSNMVLLLKQYYLYQKDDYQNSLVYLKYPQIDNGKFKYINFNDVENAEKMTHGDILTMFATIDEIRSMELPTMDSFMNSYKSVEILSDKKYKRKQIEQKIRNIELDENIKKQVDTLKRIANNRKKFVNINEVTIQKNDFPHKEWSIMLDQHAQSIFPQYAKYCEKKDAIWAQFS